MLRMASRDAMRCVVMAILSLWPVAMIAQRDIEVRGNAAGAPIREIDDPSSGARWMLYRADGGGPGRLVLVTVPTSEHGRAESARPIVPRPVIHAGDRIVLVEHTPVVDASLEATALGPAAAGSEMRVRLAIGGRIVPAIALGPGRAEIQPVEERQP